MNINFILNATNYTDTQLSVMFVQKDTNPNAKSVRKDFSKMTYS